MNAIQSQSGNTSTLRRSQRLYVGVEVRVVVRRENKKLSAETTKTLIISANGASIPLRTVVAVGEILAVRNLQTQQEASCRVVDLEFNDESEMTEVEIEFIEPAPRFWSVFFPPEGWNSRNAEAKGYVPRIVPPLTPSSSSLRASGKLR